MDNIEYELEIWEAEINAVSGGIHRWLDRNPDTVSLIKDIHGKIRQYDFQSDEAINLLSFCEKLVWSRMDAVNWLGEDYLYSDIFSCAYDQAIAPFSKWWAK